MQGVIIENRPALDIIAQQDAPETLFYIDPPYVPAVRGRQHKYFAELDDGRAQGIGGRAQGTQGHGDNKWLPL